MPGGGDKSIGGRIISGIWCCVIDLNGTSGGNNDSSLDIQKEHISPTLYFLCWVSTTYCHISPRKNYTAKKVNMEKYLFTIPSSVQNNHSLRDLEKLEIFWEIWIKWRFFGKSPKMFWDGLERRAAVTIQGEREQNWWSNKYRNTPTNLVPHYRQQLRQNRKVALK